MIKGLAWYLPLTFVFTTLLTIWFLFRSARPAGLDSKPFRLLAVFVPLWLLLTGYLATTEFYRYIDAVPPRVFVFGVLPALIIIVAYFIFFRENFIEKLSLKHLTLLHMIRFPVEIVLLWLYNAGQIPRIMTFEGWNFDIFSGLTAPLVFWLAFRNGGLNRTLLVVWNLVTLGLLFNIVAIAVLSFRSPIQQLAFDQPNVGVTYLPFIWLPAIVVPIVFFSHVAALWKLRIMHVT